MVPRRARAGHENILATLSFDGEFAAHYIDAVSVITRSAEKKIEYGALLFASVIRPGIPLIWSTPSLNVAKVSTLDEYMENLAKGDERAKADWAKANPGKPYPWTSGNAALRAELEAGLKGHEAVVLRYVHVKRAGEKR